MQEEPYIALQWWTADQPYGDVVEAFRVIETADTLRLSSLLRYVRLYGNSEYGGYTPFSHNQVVDTARVTMNVIKAVCDTAVSRLSRQRPRPRFLTHGGNWSLQRRARLLEQFTDQAFYQGGLYQLAPKVLLDAAVLGTGCLKIYRKGSEVQFERVFPGELFVDPVDGFYGSPRNFYQRKFIDRQVLLRLFPNHAAEIRQASRTTDNIDFGNTTLVDQIEVLEAWHLPSGEGATDGRHVICISNATLVDEQWDKGSFPFVFVRWTDPMLGFWGEGVACDIQGMQVEINKLLMKIQRAFHLMSVPRIYVENGSKIRKSFFNNEIGTIIPYTGQPPVQMTPPSLNREIFDHLERLYNRSFEIAGISQMAATSMKPAGLNSGAALREYQDVESLRFTTVSRQYEELFVEAARQVVGLGKDIYSEDNRHSVVVAKDSKTIDVVDWEAVDMDADSYVLKVHPSSSLPVTPSGRLAFVEQMIALGLVGPEEAKDLLDFPDLEAKLSLDRAASTLIDRNVELMLDEGVYTPPEPYQDHQLALKKVTAALMKAEQNNVEPERLSLMREYLAQTHLMMEQARQQALANAQGMMMPGAPPAPGMGGAPPTAIGATDGTMPV